MFVSYDIDKRELESTPLTSLGGLMAVAMALPTQANMDEDCATRAPPPAPPEAAGAGRPVPAADNDDDVAAAEVLEGAEVPIIQSYHDSPEALFCC